jgi:membrane peptidoglycan carboxypeptidase
MARPADKAGRVEQARMYLRVLSLLIAQRRPSFYLGTEDGQLALASVTDVYLGLLDRAGVVPSWLAEEARGIGSQFALRRVPSEGMSGPVANKAAGSMRAHLLGLTGTGSVYDLDRMDVVVESTLDMEWHRATTELLENLGDRDFLATNGFLQQGLLSTGDPEQVLYSVLLMERTERGNAIRIQADNYDGDMSLSDGSRLELGSTAKLRTLVTYLEVIEELFGNLVYLDADSLRSLAKGDPLTRWVSEDLIARPGATLDEVLRASLQRRYSASPNERFVTGGSELTFSNFDHQYDNRLLTVEEAFRNSVNLPFIRVMRDIVEYEVSRLGSSRLVEEDVDSWRRDYLLRFAEREGGQFVRRFHTKYRDRSGPEVFDALLGERHLGMAQVAWAVRTVAPEAPLEAFGDLVRLYGPDRFTEDVHLMELYRRTDPEGLGLSDLGYLSRIHPLELWVASYRLQQT